jgi:hypothetical protein
MTHRTIIGSSAVRQLAAESGFEVIAIREPSFPVIGLGLKRAIRRSVVLAFRSCINRFISIVMMGNSKVVLTPNLCFVLKRTGS